MAEYFFKDDGTLERPGYRKPRKPDNHMVWAIISITICFLFGILSLIESIKVDSLYAQDDYDGAVRASEKAKQWAMWSLYAWMALFALAIICGLAS